MTGVLPVDQNTEGRIWPRIGSHDGGRYLDIPLHHRVRGFTTVQGTGCGTCLTNFAAEMERERASQRTHDALLRKAKALQVTGGKVYGYDNVEVLGEAPDREGRRARLFVVRQINREQAAIVTRIFELYARGLGLTRIAKTLNAERVPAPRGLGWAGSAIREMLYRELYRGVIVWNRSQKIVRGGTKRQRKRPKNEWVAVPAPKLQIVSDELWSAVHERLAKASTWFARMQQGGALNGRPSHAESAYLLTGFATCAVCRGPLATISRMHGTAPHRHVARFYGCTVHQKRGRTICSNRVVLRQEIVDQALLSAISEVLDERVLNAALDKALDRFQTEAACSQDRHARLERELSHIESRINRLLDILAEGSAPTDEVVGRLNAEKARKTELALELERMSRPSAGQPLNGARLKEVLRSRLTDVKALLGRHSPMPVRYLGNYSPTRSRWSRSCRIDSEAIASEARSRSTGCSQARQENSSQVGGPTT